jgi:hypothetical protein
VNVTNHDGRPFSTGAGTSSTSKFVAGPGKCSYAGILLGCSRWRKLVEYRKRKVTDWSNAGIGAYGFLRLQKHRTELILWDMILQIITISETLTRTEV